MVHCIMTVDLEEWFHGLDIPRDLWEQYESRLEFSAYELLRILHEHRASATFFVLADIAKKYPSLISDIQRERHEVASHGSVHQRYLLLSDNAIRDDIVESVNIISDIIGRKPLGFRAPCFSVTKKNIWILEFLTEHGFQYDSSVFPVRIDRYGANDFPTRPYRIQNSKGTIWEFPVTPVQYWPIRIPFAGGAYFRILPFFLLKRFLKRAALMNGVITFYIHPWELDDGQPRLYLPYRLSLTHYFGLRHFRAKLERLISSFRFGTIAQYLEMQSTRNLKEE